MRILSFILRLSIYDGLGIMPISALYMGYICLTKFRIMINIITTDALFVQMNKIIEGL